MTDAPAAMCGDDPREAIWARRFDVPVLIAALLVIPVIVIEESRASHGWKVVGRGLNWAIWVVFAVEAITLLSLARRRGAWIRTHPLEVAIVLLTPPFLPASLQAARLFRLVRLVRLLRLAVVGRRLFSLEGLRWAAVVALLTALGGGAAYAAVEDTAERHLSTWDGVWWAVTTMTTVGYGDLSPRTNLGRAIAVGVMVVGIGFGSLVIAAVAQRFVVTELQGEEARIERQVATAETDVLAEIAELRRHLERLERAVRER